VPTSLRSLRELRLGKPVSIYLAKREKDAPPKPQAKAGYAWRSRARPKRSVSGEAERSESEDGLAPQASYG